MSRITVEDAARLWHEASDDELRDLARAGQIAPRVDGAEPAAAELPGEQVAVGDRPSGHPAALRCCCGLRHGDLFCRRGPMSFFRTWIRGLRRASAGPLAQPQAVIGSSGAAGRLF